MMGNHKWKCLGILCISAACVLAAPRVVENNSPHSVNVSSSVARQWLSKAGELATLGQKDGLQFYNYTWIVENITEKLGPSFLSISSGPFYTDIPGYRVYISLDPHDRNNSYIGVYLGLIKGEFDDLLSWPFTNRYEISSATPDGFRFTYININPMVTNCSTAEVFVHPPNKQKCGTSEYIKRGTLLANKDKYLLNGNLAINVVIYLNN